MGDKCSFLINKTNIHMIVEITNLKGGPTRRLVGFIGVNDSDFHKEPVLGNPDRIRRIPNQHFYKKLLKELGTPWEEYYSWKILKDNEIEARIKKYSRVAHFYSALSNRLTTLNDL